MATKPIVELSEFEAHIVSGNGNCNCFIVDLTPSYHGGSYMKLPSWYTSQYTNFEDCNHVCCRAGDAVRIVGDAGKLAAFGFLDASYTEYSCTGSPLGGVTPPNRLGF